MEGETKKFEIPDRLFYLLAILLIGILSLWATLIFKEIKNLPENYPREITVSAEGRAFAAPDIAQVKLGVESEGMNISNIFKENTEKMNAILEEIKGLGIEEKDIQTTSYSLSPRYDWIEGKRIFRGYTLRQEIKVKIRNFDKIGVVLEKGTEKGANVVGELQFAIDEPEKIREIARADAIEKAKAKAKQIAEKTGLELVKVVNIYEGYYYSPAREYEIGEGMKMVAAPEMQALPEIQPGEQEVKLGVSLIYRVR